MAGIAAKSPSDFTLQNVLGSSKWIYVRPYVSVDNEVVRPEHNLGLCSMPHAKACVCASRGCDTRDANPTKDFASRPKHVNSGLPYRLALA